VYSILAIKEVLQMILDVAAVLPQLPELVTQA
jgi:hypothetical protein